MDTNALDIAQLWHKSWKRQVMKTCTYKWQNKVRHKPSNASFSSPLPSRIVVCTFPHLLRVSTELLQRAFEIEANRCFFGSKKKPGERCKKHAQTDHQKDSHIGQICGQKHGQEKWFFCGFQGSGAEGAPRWSQGPPRAPSKAKC